MKVKGDDIVSAQQWLLDREFGVWYRFDSIPDAIFEQVFELIDEGFRGYFYFFDDFDEAFYKSLYYKKNSYTINREKRLKRRESKLLRQAQAEKECIKVGLYYLNLKNKHNQGIPD